jgi:hypothetical protein
MPPRNECQARTGGSVAQQPEPSPEPVSRLPKPPRQASTGHTHAAATVWDQYGIRRPGNDDAQVGGNRL